MKGQAIRVGQHIVGVVQRDTFYKTVKGSLHFLRKPPAIASDVSALYDALKAGARFMQVTDSETGKIYRASIDAILTRGFSLNRGFGKQVALPFEQWSGANEPLAVQPALWQTAEPSQQ